MISSHFEVEKHFLLRSLKFELGMVEICIGVHVLLSVWRKNNFFCFAYIFLKSEETTNWQQYSKHNSVAENKHFFFKIKTIRSIFFFYSV